MHPVSPERNTQQPELITGSAISAQPSRATEEFLFVEKEYPPGLPGKLIELFSFDGRYDRDRFWVVYLSTILLAFLTPLLYFWPLEWIWIVALTWIMIATVAKRFHDRNKKALWILIALIPYLGTVWLLYECGVLPGNNEINRYGGKRRNAKELFSQTTT